MAKTYQTHEELIAALRAWPPDSLPAVELTPTLAQSILDHDPVNRKLRPGNLERLKREITGGHFQLQKSTAMRFLQSGRLADGQHRCRAVIETGISIIVPMAIVDDTLGVDEGALRTVTDDVSLRGVPVEQASIAAQVIHAICKIRNAGRREFVQYFEEHQPFILECVTKPAEWLAEHDRIVSVFLKPSMLAIIRAQAITLYEEPPVEVDTLLYDIVNAGMTAPEGSARREVARQIFEHLRMAYERKGTKQRDVMAYIRRALILSREGKIRNVITTARPLARKRKGKAEKAA